MLAPDGSVTLPVMSAVTCARNLFTPAHMVPSPLNFLADLFDWASTRRRCRHSTNLLGRIQQHRTGCFGRTDGVRDSRTAAGRRSDLSGSRKFAGESSTGDRTVYTFRAPEAKRKSMLSHVSRGRRQTWLAFPLALSHKICGRPSI